MARRLGFLDGAQSEEEKAAFEFVLVVDDEEIEDQECYEKAHTDMEGTRNGVIDLAYTSFLLAKL